MSGEEHMLDLKKKREKSINPQADEVNSSLKSMKCFIPVKIPPIIL